MEKLQSVIVRDAVMGKSGTSSYGPWQAWSVYLEGYEVKFSYFEKDGIIPFPGMQIALLEYTVEQSGEYTNYNVKKLVPVQLGESGKFPVLGSKPVGLGKLPVRGGVVKSDISDGLPSASESKSVLMCASYVKDIMVELIQINDSPYRSAKMSEIVDVVARGGKRLAKLLTGGGVPPMPMGVDKVTKPVTMTKPESITPAKVAELRGDGLPEGGLPTTPGTVVPITREMVKAANNALPGTKPEQLSLPGATPAYDDDVPF